MDGSKAAALGIPALDSASLGMASLRLSPRQCSPGAANPITLSCFKAHYRVETGAQPYPPI